jgi:L-ascorbate metabolism protein UlaG (beta-lactamase superfamily)
MKRLIYTLFLIFAFTACKNNKETHKTETVQNSQKEVSTPTETPKNKGLKINPIEHATMVLQWDDITIYVDPVGGKKAFRGFATPDLVLITDIHGDHFDVPTLESIVAEKTKMIVPRAVMHKLPEALKSKADVFNNGENVDILGLNVEAMPMYNLRKEARRYHPRGRGNGYVLEKDGKRVYISGDTEDIPEMRNLKDIDIAFVCMNLPYTMTVEKAAEAVLAFKPKAVYPYHYRGENGFSDVAKFKSLVEAGNPNIKVVQLDWYPKK